MEWEIDRHDWASVGASEDLPNWIVQLVETGDSTRANELLVLIESAVVPVNGKMKIGAAEVAACLVQGLLSSTPVSRVEILHLLFLLAGGVVSDIQSDLSDKVGREIELGLPIYSEIAETGTRSERFQCIDLLSFYVRFAGPHTERAIRVMKQIASVGAEEAVAVAAEFEDLISDGILLKSSIQ